MKKLLFFICFIGISATVLSQSYWSKTYDMVNDADRGYRLDVAEDGSMIVVSLSLCNQQSVGCLTMTKLDSSGNIIWKKIENNHPNDIIATYVKTLKSGKSFIGVRKVNFGLKTDKTFLRQINREGETEWEIKINFPDSTPFIYQIIEKSPNEILCFVSGYPEKGNQELYTNGVIAFDTLGNELFTIDFTTDIDTSVPISIQPYMEDQWLMASLDWDWDDPTWNSFRPVRTVKRFDKDFNLIYEFTYGPENLGGIPCTSDSLGNIYCTFEKRRGVENGSFSSAAIISFDSLGNESWHYIFDQPETKSISTLYRPYLTPDGNIVAYGMEEPTIGPFAYKRNGWLVNMDTEGNLRWKRHYNFLDFPSKGGAFEHMKIDKHGNYLITGDMTDTFPDGPSYVKDNTWVLRLDRDGCIEPGCDASTILLSTKDAKSSTQHTSLFHTYPNPAEDYFNLIRNEDFIREELWITLYDMQGRVLQQFTSNESQIRIETATLANGLYWVKAQSGKYWNTEKVVVSRGE